MMHGVEYFWWYFLSQSVVWACWKMCDLLWEVVRLFMFPRLILCSFPSILLEDSWIGMGSCERESSKEEEGWEHISCPL